MDFSLVCLHFIFSETKDRKHQSCDDHIPSYSRTRHFRHPSQLSSAFYFQIILVLVFSFLLSPSFLNLFTVYTFTLRFDCTPLSFFCDHFFITFRCWISGIFFNEIYREIAIWVKTEAYLAFPSLILLSCETILANSTCIPDNDGDALIFIKGQWVDASF